MSITAAPRHLTRDGFALVESPDDWTARKAELESENRWAEYIDEDNPVSYPCLARSVIENHDDGSPVWYHYFVYADEVAVLLQDLG